MTAELSVRLVGGPTAVIELGGVRLLTDPTFDPPGDHPVGDRVLTKTTGPVSSRRTSTAGRPAVTATSSSTSAGAIARSTQK